ncbi:MAG: hypothetical protein WC979_03105 [Candidatus Pacearchaeota archaeon]|jgi:hypothetical protein|nr:hypothetical protein [Clostridia bacterium]
MSNIISYKGKIHFDPDNKTNKHESQASWKKIALIMIPGEVCEYYSWFLEKRYDIILNKPLRGAHISFINDSVADIQKGCSLVNQEDVHFIWDSLKKKYDNTEIEVILDLDPRSDGNHWWLNIPQDERTTIHGIRAEIGLGRPFFGLHMSIGYANEKNKAHSEYILRLLTNFDKNFY